MHGCLAAMHRIFQNFIDLLATAEDLQDFSKAMADTAAALDLSCFAYLALQHARRGKPRLISTYPSRWVAHYLRNNYQLLDLGDQGARHCDDGFLDELLEPPQRTERGTRMNGADTAGMACAPSLE